MKTVGIIGGLGPEATNHLILKIIEGFELSGETSRPNILVDFVPVGIETESNLILKNEPGDFVEILTNSAKRLAVSAVFVIIACNSVHMFVDNIRSAVDIPVLSVIDEVCGLDLKEVGILATEFTIKNKLFEHAGNLHNPDMMSQLAINATIDKLVKRKSIDQVDVEKIESLLSFWEQKMVFTCILGCSEMQLLSKLWKKWSKRIKFIDTMDILAKATVKNLLN